MTVSQLPQRFGPETDLIKDKEVRSLIISLELKIKDLTILVLTLLALDRFRNDFEVCVPNQLPRYQLSYFSPIFYNASVYIRLYFK